MNRRQLFAALAAAAAAPGELWKPTRSIFLPPKGGWPWREMSGAAIFEYEDRWDTWRKVDPKDCVTFSCCPVDFGIGPITAWALGDGRLQFYQGGELLLSRGPT